MEVSLQRQLLPEFLCCVEKESLKQLLEMLLSSSSWEPQNITAGCLPFESYFSFAGITDSETPKLTTEKPQVDAMYLGDPMQGTSTGVNVLNMFTQPRDIQKLQRRNIPRKMRWTPKNTLVLEMEGTLALSSLTAVWDDASTFTTPFQDRYYQVSIKLRPHLPEFLEALAKIYEIFVFTTAKQDYADQMLKVLGPQRKLIRHQLYQEDCLCSHGSYVKDLSVVERDLDRTVAVATYLQAFPYQEQAKQFRSQPAQAVGPKGLLYVQQREFAATTSKDGSVSIIGSDDATTCHFVVLRHTGSGAICLTHCDGSDTETEVLLVINAVKVLSPSTDCGRLELHLIGGFCDDRRLSQRLTSQLLRAFDRLLDNVYLMTFCVTELNDRQENGRHLPYIYSIAANVKTGEIFHATFPDRGPDEDMRSARVLAGAKMISIYDSKKEQLCIGPYYWMPFPHVDFWLEQSNQSILQNLSTSPLAEPPHFVAHIRATLLYLREHPFPDKTLFPTQKPRLYKKNAEGLWERVSGQI